LTPQEYKNLKKLIQLVVKEQEDLAIKKGYDITSQKYLDFIRDIKSAILIKAGFTLEEFEQLNKKPKPSYKELEDKPDILDEERVKKIAEQVKIPPQIIKKTEIVKEIVKEKPINRIIKTKEIIREVDTKVVSEIQKDLLKLQEDYTDFVTKARDLEKDIKTTKDFIKDIDGTIEGKITPEIEKFSKEVHSKLLWVQSALQSKLSSYVETDPLSLHLDQTTPQTILNDTFKLDTLKSKTILGTDANGKIIEGTHQSLAGYVPYTGATANVDLGSYNLTTTGTIRTLNTDRGILSVGNTDGFTIPSGKGIRFMWIPSKRAFRAGYAYSDYWDSANIGDYSVAIGFGAKASGLSSVALGGGAFPDVGPVASGQSAFAFGPYSTASGTGAFAMGSDTTASNFDSVAMGSGATSSGSKALAFGRSATASGETSIAIGYQAVASAQNSIAVGNQLTNSVADSIAFGVIGKALEIKSNQVNILGQVSFTGYLGELNTQDELYFHGAYDWNQDDISTIVRTGNASECGSDNENLAIDGDTDTGDSIIGDCGGSNRYWTITFTGAKTIGAVRFWIDDVGDNDEGTVPITVKYYDGADWVTFGTLGAAFDQWNTIEADGITATSWRLYTESSYGMGLQEIEFSPPPNKGSIYHDGINLIINPKEVGTGKLDVLGILQTDGYNSADGSEGLTQDVTVRNAAGDGTTTLSYKNGLLVAVT
jgi:hypothetical protein